MGNFNPTKHLIQLKGKLYLETRYRVQWFREDHPRGCIATEVISYDPVLVKATVMDAENAVLGTAHAGAKESPNAVWSGRAIEKAETAAIGRALGHAGFGTQFAGEGDSHDEVQSGHLADSPVATQRGTANGRNGTTRVDVSTTPQKPAKSGRDLNAIFEATRHHFKHREHFDNTIPLLVNSGVLKTSMTDEQAIAAINANREAEGKADKGWYTDPKNLRDLPANLFTLHTMTVEQAVAKVGKLDTFPSMRAFLDAVNEVEAAAKQRAEATA